MNDKATIYEVARMSGFSTATVSRVMHDGTGFSATTRDSVLEVAARLGWVPNHSARSLARRRAGIVGLLFPDFGDDGPGSESALYVDQVIRGAERAATLAGDAILIAATRGREGLDLARSVVGKVDGMVVMAGSLAAKDLADISTRVPVVMMATHTAPHRLDFVGADNRGGAAALASHLTSTHGYDDIAFVAGPRRSPDSRERFVGFRDALLAAGLEVPDAPEAHGDFTESGGAEAVEALLAARRTPPRAIVLGNDEMAIGALTVLRRHKLRVPADVAVTGFDDIATSRHVRPTLTTVRQPMRDIGETAVGTLLSRLADRTGPRQTTVLPTELVLRASCGCSARGGQK
ncbi:LacI family DNA-binding transcriptional regulator [Nocardioides cynanchi]|uniref:LacI family DNA-binding transcriptional regulator n=1 Tax=Nocardioides cynanchi TaxID=2558918 RepID=UPI00124435A3|nr:LacI family DNA-binding transcriptional regulator [Nocardioides cynanchi]